MFANKWALTRLKILPTLVFPHKLYLYMCVCMYVRMYVCMYVCVCVCVCVEMINWGESDNKIEIYGKWINQTLKTGLESVTFRSFISVLRTFSNWSDIWVFSIYKQMRKMTKWWRW